VEEDRVRSEQAQKEGKEYERVYSAIKNGTGSLEVIYYKKLKKTYKKNGRAPEW
jgi:hypothetical protein